MSTPSENDAQVSQDILSLSRRPQQHLDYDQRLIGLNPVTSRTVPETRVCPDFIQDQVVKVDPSFIGAGLPLPLPRVFRSRVRLDYGRLYNSFPLLLSSERSRRCRRDLGRTAEEGRWHEGGITTPSFPPPGKCSHMFAISKTTARNLEETHRKRTQDAPPTSHLHTVNTFPFYGALDNNTAVKRDSELDVVIHMLPLFPFRVKDSIWDGVTRPSLNHV